MIQTKQTVTIALLHEQFILISRGDMSCKTYKPSKDVIFRSSWTVWPWRWRQCYRPKRLELLKRWRIVTFQKVQTPAAPLCELLFWRFVSKKIFTVCSKKSNRIFLVPIYITMYTLYKSEIEVNITNIREKCVIREYVRWWTGCSKLCCGLLCLCLVYIDYRS